MHFLSLLVYIAIPIGCLAQFRPALDIQAFGINFVDQGVKVDPGRLTNVNFVSVQQTKVFGVAARYEIPGLAPYSGVRNGSDIEAYNNAIKSTFSGLFGENINKWPNWQLKPPGDTSNMMAKSIYDTQFVNFAKSNNMAMRWHTLEWFRQDGRYATHWSRQQGCEAYAQFLREHVTSVATNYKDFVYAYDVFNEVVDNRRWADDCNLWDTVIPDTFRLLQTLHPNSLRCLNEMTFLLAGTQPNRTNTFMSILQRLLDAGAPINCVGMQAHFGGPGNVNATAIRTRLDLVSSKVPYIIVSEVSMPQGNMTDDQFSDVMFNLVNLVARHRAVVEVDLWGFVDQTVKVTSDTFVGGIFRRDYTPKKAVSTLPGLFYTRVFNTPVNSQGQYAFRGPTVAYRWSARLDGILNLEGTVTLAAGTNNIDISTNAVVTASSNSPLQAGFQSARAASSSVSSPPVSNVSLTLVKHFGVTARLEGNPNPPPNGVALLGDALARYQQQERLTMWPVWEPTPGNTADAQAVFAAQYVDYARRNNLQLRWRALEWYRQNNTLFANHWSRSLSCSKYEVALRTRINRVVTQYRDVVYAWDVFQELLRSNGRITTCNFWNTLVPQAFTQVAGLTTSRTLRCLAETSILNTETPETTVDEFVALVRQIRAASPSFNCVNLLSPLQSVASVNGSLITARLNKLAAVIPRILVTDILLPSSTDASAWANALLRFVRTAAVHPSVMEVSMSKLWDGELFANGAGLFDNSWNPKPPATTLPRIFALSGGPNLAANIQGVVSFSGLPGVYDWSAIASGTTQTGRVFVSGAQPIPVVVVP